MEHHFIPCFGTISMDTIHMKIINALKLRINHNQYVPNQPLSITPPLNNVLYVYKISIGIISRVHYHVDTFTILPVFANGVVYLDLSRKNHRVHYVGNRSLYILCSFAINIYFFLLQTVGVVVVFTNLLHEVECKLAH